jgi:hypothetical protein
MTIFVGGPLDGKEWEVPPNQYGSTPSELLIPYTTFYPSHPAYQQGRHIYQRDFDGRYYFVRTEVEFNEG